MEERNVKVMLVEYFEQRAEWRRQAAVDAQDARGARSARGLLDVADYVRDLPEDDARLLRIQTVDLDPSGEVTERLVVGTGAEDVADRFRYDDLLEDPDALLTRFAAKMEADGSALYAEGRTVGEIAGDLESDRPMAALLAVRYMGEHVDGWEERAVGLAREAGWSWDRIATVLGRTRQSVWSKHRDAAPRNVLGGAIATTTRAARKVRSVLEAVPQPSFGHGHDTALPAPAPTEVAGTEMTPEAAPAS